MKTLAYLAWCASACALAFGQPTKTASASPTLPAADLAAIRSLIDTYRQHVIENAWSKWASLFTTDALMMPPNGAAISGRAAIEAWVRLFPPFTQFHSPIAELEGAGANATARGIYTFTAGAPNQPPQKDAGKWICTFRRQADGAWKYHRCIYNSDLAPAAATDVSAAAATGSGEVAALADIRRALIAKINTTLDATERRDEACFASFSSAPEVRFAAQGVPLTLAEFKNGWRKGIATSPRQEFSNRQMVVRVLSPDFAVSTTHGDYRNFGPSGAVSQTVPFVFTAVWQREGSDWRIVDAHESTPTGWPSAK